MSETESRGRCKIVVMRRDEGRVRFGLSDSGARLAVHSAPFPDLLAIDSALDAFARDVLGLGRVRIHERFVARPERNGAIYYLVEAEPEPLSLGGAAGPGAPDRRVEWIEARQAASRLDPPDRAALALAMRFLSGIRG